jgi:hypothetical protein
MVYCCIRCNKNFEDKNDLRRHYNRKIVCINLTGNEISHQDCIASLDKSDPLLKQDLCNKEKMIKLLQEELDKKDTMIKLLQEENTILIKQVSLTDTKGYIYVMSNNSFNIDNYPIYKIGCSKDPDRRKKEFSTSVLTEINIVHVSKLFNNRLLAEKKLFELIKDHRCNKKREFFNIDLVKLVDIIENMTM